VENKFTISIWNTCHFGFGARHLDDFQKGSWTKNEREESATPDCELTEAAQFTGVCFLCLSE